MARCKFTLTALVGLFALLTSSLAQADLSIVPLPSDFKTHMEIDKKYPMVLDGFSAKSEQQVQDFYTHKLGEPDKVTRDIGRYTLFYTVADYPVRISIYPHNGNTQISAMVSNKPQ